MSVVHEETISIPRTQADREALEREKAERAERESLIQEVADLKINAGELPAWDREVWISTAEIHWENDFLREHRDRLLRGEPLPPAIKVISFAELEEQKAAARERQRLAAEGQTAPTPPKRFTKKQLLDYRARVKTAMKIAKQAINVENYTYAAKVLTDVQNDHVQLYAPEDKD